MKSVFKSLLAAIMGTGVFFFFLMMAVVPTMALLGRMNENIAKTSVVVNPGAFLRTFGVPAALVMFVVLFLMGYVRLRRRQELPAAARD